MSNNGSSPQSLVGTRRTRLNRDNQQMHQQNDSGNSDQEMVDGSLKEDTPSKANPGGQQTLSKFLGAKDRDDKELVQVMTKGPKQ
jgi:hypothetical protein